VIFIGIDDTDVLGTPGTNQLARAILKRIGNASRGSILCRHQLFFDPRVPYTSKNGSASIQLPHAAKENLPNLIEVIRDVMHIWFVIGSDPGLCAATEVSQEVKEFACRCQSQIVMQDEARSIAARAGCYLEGLGGTEQGIIGALAAIGLIAGGDDGRIVHLDSWAYPDEEFSGAQELETIFARGVDEVRLIESNVAVTAGPVDIGKHLRPNWRNGRIVLYVNAAESGSAVPWRAVKLP
jgi:tRNA(Ile2) C34 agmatinyltransferase TiaS